MKLALVIGLIVLLALCAVLFLGHESATTIKHEPSLINQSSSPIDQPSIDHQPSTNSSVPTSPLAEHLNDPTNSAKDDVQILHALLSQFLIAVKEPYRPPLGLNEDVSRALTGHNRLHLAFVASDHPALNDKGQLVDRWGTPYYFHPRSAESFEIRSAGPDLALFTGDDVIENPGAK